MLWLAKHIVGSNQRNVTVIRYREQVSVGPRSEQFLNGTWAHNRLFSAKKL